MQPKYIINGAVHDVTPIRRADRIVLSIDGHLLTVRLPWRDGHRGEITVNDRRYGFYAAQDGNILYLHVGGKSWQLEVYNEFAAPLGTDDSGGRLCASMPGVVVETFVNVGDSVVAGTSVMLIESMKLQTEIRATISGVVAVVAVEAGSSFDKGAVLVSIEASGAMDNDTGTTGQAGRE